MVDDTNKSGDETSTTFSKEELQAMIEAVVTKIVPPIVGKAVNGAITDRNDKFEKQILEQVKQQFGVKEESTPAKSKKTVDPEFLGLQEEIKALKAEKEAEKSQFRDKELRRVLSEELEFHGVDKLKRKALAASLLLEDKIVGYSEHDPEKIIFKTKDGLELPLRQGLTKDYFMGEEGKSWLPPKDIKGSGSKTARPALPVFDQEQAAIAALSKLY